MAKSFFDAGDTARGWEHRRKSEGYYSRKEKVVYAAIRRGWVTIDCVHRNGMEILPCIRIGGVLFHMKCESVDPSHKLVDLPRGWTSPAVPEGTMMPLVAAESLLNRLLSEEADDWRSEVSIEGVTLREYTGAQIRQGEITDSSDDEMQVTFCELRERLDKLAERMAVIKSEYDEQDSTEDDSDEEYDRQEVIDEVTPVGQFQPRQPACV